MDGYEDWLARREEQNGACSLASLGLCPDCDEGLIESIHVEREVDYAIEQRAGIDV